jgi:RNA polymerase sigma-70 factor (ECF subfamily)
MSDVVAAALLSLLPRLRRFAASLTGARDSGDALVQAACERALRTADDRPPDTRLDVWLYRLMRGLWHGAAAPASSSVPMHDGNGSAGPTLDAIRAGLGALSPDDRTVLLLVCAEGFTYAETAAALDLQIGTIATRLARARLALSAAEIEEIE